jgi:hypothetical protein
MTGSAPVLIRIVSAVTVCSPTVTVCGSTNLAAPVSTVACAESAAKLPWRIISRIDWTAATERS